MLALGLRENLEERIHGEQSIRAVFGEGGQSVSKACIEPDGQPPDEVRESRLFLRNKKRIRGLDGASCQK